MSSGPDFAVDWAISSSMCRVCLRSEPAATWNLFECSTAGGRNLAEALSSVGGIPVRKGEDNFPQSCCSDCFRKVEVAFELREKFLESNQRLEAIFAVTVKNECFEEDDSLAVPAQQEEEEDAGSVASVLQHFGLDGFAGVVEEQDVETVELFSCLLEQDLQKMLANETVGTIIRFRKAVEHAKQLLSQDPSDEKKSTLNELEPVPRKKRRREILSPAILAPNLNQPQLNLNELLQTIEGRLILTHYKRNGNQLDKRNQHKLLKLIVEKLAENVQIQDMQRSWFDVIFAAIVEAFPSERHLRDFYWDKLAQIRYKIKRKINNGIRMRSAGQSGEARGNVEENLVDAEEAIASKAWLQRGREPWETVLEHWDKSFQLRKKVYKGDSGNKLGELCRDDVFPILKESNGIELIRRDFNRMFAPTSDVFQVWNRIKKGVCDFGRLNFKNKTLLEVLAQFEEGGWTDDHLFIQILAGLLPPGITARKFRPSFQETNNAFMREIKSFADVPEAIERYRSVLAEHKLSVQPHVLFIADESRYLIYVSEGIRPYEARGLLDAIDGVLKLCMVMEMGYTADGKPMWTFIQRFCYGLKTSGDNVYTCLKTLHAFLSKE